MSAHAITLRLPPPLYSHFRSRAERSHRSLEAEILNAVASVAADKEDLPEDLAGAITDLQVLSDDELRLAARNRLSEESRVKLEALNFKQQSEGLTASEKETQAQLVDAYDQAVLLRAEALRLLKERGHDVSELLTSR